MSIMEKITEKARKSIKRIVLAEGTEEDVYKRQA